MNEDRPGNNLPPSPSSPGYDSGGNDSEPDNQAYRILVANEQATLAINEDRLAAASRAILAESAYRSAVVSIAVVDDPTIHALNVQYLRHDYPTDVLSFVLEDSPQCLEGELVISADTAVREAALAGWSSHDELLLYVIHGTLHLVGYLDDKPEEQAEMYTAEADYLHKMGVVLPPDSSRWRARVGDTDGTTSREESLS